MILQAEVSKRGILTAKVPKSLWGKTVKVSIKEPPAEKSDWEQILKIFEKADALDFPRRTHAEILKELRAFKETE